MNRRVRSIQYVLEISLISYAETESSATPLITASPRQQWHYGLSNQELIVSYQCAISKCPPCTNGQSCDSTNADCLMERHFAVGEQSNPNLSRKESSRKKKLTRFLVGWLMEKSAIDSEELCTIFVIGEN